MSVREKGTESLRQGYPCQDEQKGETEYGITTGCEYPFKLCESEAA